MALWLKDRRLVFVHVHRAAGTTVRQVLGDGVEVGDLHCTAQQARDLFRRNRQAARWAAALVIAVARHPYDWWRSIYGWVASNAGHPDHAHANALGRLGFFDWAAGHPRYTTLCGFMLEDGGNWLVNRVLRFEQFPHALEPHLKDWPSPVPRLNAGPEAPPLTDAEREFLWNRYPDDFERFGYVP